MYILVNAEECTTSEEVVKTTAAAASWSQTFQGCPITKLNVDAVTLTEVLRLHILGSGGRTVESASSWRYNLLSND